MDRRKFLTTLTAGTATLASQLARAADKNGHHTIKKIGLQLYTVRDRMKQDFNGTLSKVASIGYREVEFAGYYGHSPKDVRAAIDRVGLVAPSNHVDWKTVSVPANWQQALDAAHIVGHSYIVNPYIDDDVRNQPDGWKKAAEVFNHAGEVSKKQGIQFCYHNHWFAFIPMADGKLPYDLLLQETDPNYVKMEMDLCWISVGGVDPVTYFKRYPGRFPLVHVKDLKKIPQPTVVHGGKATFDEMDALLTSVGGGVIDWKRIFAHSAQAGIKHYFVENDEPGDHPFQNIAASYRYLAQLQF
jgi:sugar phosphate isomerase/epimerase